MSSVHRQSPESSSRLVRAVGGNVSFSRISRIACIVLRVAVASGDRIASRKRLVLEGLPLVCPMSGEPKPRWAIPQLRSISAVRKRSARQASGALCIHGVGGHPAVTWNGPGQDGCECARPRDNLKLGEGMTSVTSSSAVSYASRLCKCFVFCPRASCEGDSGRPSPP